VQSKITGKCDRSIGKKCRIHSFLHCYDPFALVANATKFSRSNKFSRFDKSEKSDKSNLFAFLTDETDLNAFINKAMDDGDINFVNYKEFTSIEKIGEGGFNSVYKSEWKKGGLTVALKSLKDINIDGMTVKKSEREV
ncbi:39457_t:CDS:2, partial [Gigaspora margarita]